MADTGFVSSGVGGVAAIGIVGIAGDILVPTNLASIDGISLIGDVTTAGTVDTIAAGSENVYVGDCIGSVVCTVVTPVVLATVCECVRDRTTRFICAGGKPKLYSTISSSKRFRLIERDELKIKRN